MSTETAVIRAEPHTEIGTVIARDADLLVERWCQRALSEHPTAARVHYDVLRNHLGAFFRAMGRVLIQSGDGDPRKHRDRAIEHGEQRWDEGWSITELVRDYQLVQLTVLEHLETTLERPLGYREIMAVGVFIDDAVAAGIAAFVANRDLHIREKERLLREAQQEIDRRKDNFLALVTHELRDPLAPILNSARALALMLPDAAPPVIESVRIIRRQARQLSRLLEDLSDLTRIAQGRLELRKTPVDVAEVIEQAVQTCAPVLKARAHSLALHVAPEVLLVHGDAGRLTQVVVNLLTNAAKYTPPGGQIIVTATRQDHGIVARVRDTGVGIEPHMIEQVFDLYTRAKVPLEQSPDGLGIGLALVKQLVTLHGGTVEATSAGSGGGSEFVLTFPPYKGAAQSDSVTPTGPMSIGPRRLLVVEDDPDSRESLTALLRLMGHDVESAADGRGAIQLISSKSFDAALIDIGLPDLSGYEVAAQGREIVGDKVLLIALTGYGQSEHVKRALESGFDAHLVKPLDTTALGQLLGARRVSR
jgi:signal transduction histidine kinase